MSKALYLQEHRGPRVITPLQERQNRPVLLAWKITTLHNREAEEVWAVQSLGLGLADLGHTHFMNLDRSLNLSLP